MTPISVGDKIAFVVGMLFIVVVLAQSAHHFSH